MDHYYQWAISYYNVVNLNAFIINKIMLCFG